ncbi:MAG: DUF1592 domain-containing protein [Fuerstiella sp.]
MSTNIHHVSVLLIALCCPATVVAQSATIDQQRATSQPRSASAVALHAKAFFNTHCFDCHNADNAEAGFDVEELGDHATAKNFDRWVEVFDRVADGEMPPANMDRPKKKELSSFLSETRKTLHQRQQSQFDRLGRVQGRRLSHLQLERSLHDQLGIDVPLTIHMPEEQRTEGFTSIAAGQSISQHQLKTHLAVVDTALDEAFRRATSKPDEWSRQFSAKQLARQRANRRCREPEMLNGKAVVWTANTTYYGRLPVTTASKEGWYRMTFEANGLNVPKDHGIWCTIRSGRCISSAPMLATVGAFELTKDKQQYSFVGWLPKGHMFEIRPADQTLKQGRFAGGQIGSGEGTPQKVCGLAMSNAVLERVHLGPDGTVSTNDVVAKMLFGDLPKRALNKDGSLNSKAISPEKAVPRLMTDFAGRAFRRPVDEATIQPFIEFVLQQLRNKETFADALRSGYRAILCSPRFLYFQEAPGALDDYSIASRLSYLLWNRPPDRILLQAAAKGKLQKPWMRLQQAQRMLADKKAQSFVVDLADQWLQLNDIGFTEPDRRMFKAFDTIVQESMLKETHEFLREMLNNDLSVTHLIQSEFTFLNSRLARYYNIDNKLAASEFSGQVQKVRLAKNSPRSGLMTHGAILKVTANGTATSPVVRGVWMAEKLLGIHIPSPPENIPAIEPDIRGATTIRELLEKHKSDSSCASCHIKIDPAGFALENFDPAGQYRKFYPVVRKKTKGLPIDASSQTPDGRPFKDLKEFQSLVVQDQAALAANMVRHFIAYGTGATCEFADRDDVRKIVAKSAASNYGFRTLLMTVIASEVFASK